MAELAEKTCVPCRGGVPPLTAEEIAPLAQQLKEWRVVENHHLEREFQFADFKTALESYRASKPAFTSTGIPTDDEVKEHLVNDAQALKLLEPVPPSKVVDFSLQRDVLRELGIKG